MHHLWKTMQVDCHYSTTNKTLLYRSCCVTRILCPSPSRRWRRQVWLNPGYASLPSSNANQPSVWCGAVAFCTTNHATHTRSVVVVSCTHRGRRIRTDWITDIVRFVAAFCSDQQPAFLVLPSPAHLRSPHEPSSTPCRLRQSQRHDEFDEEGESGGVNAIGEEAKGWEEDGQVQRLLLLTTVLIRVTPVGVTMMMFGHFVTTFNLGCEVNTFFDAHFFPSPLFLPALKLFPVIKTKEFLLLLLPQNGETSLHYPVNVGSDKNWKVVANGGESCCISKHIMKFQIFDNYEMPPTKFSPSIK